MRATPASHPSRRARGRWTRATAIAVVCLLLMALAGPAAATGGGEHRYKERYRRHHRAGGEWRWRSDAGHRRKWRRHRHSDRAWHPSHHPVDDGGREGPGGGSEKPGDGAAPTEQPTDGAPGNGGLEDAVPTSEELLFYRRTAGEPIDGRARGLGEYYDVDDTAGLTLISALANWSVDHAQIVPLEIDGTDGDELLFYRPQPTGARGWGEFYDIGPNGGMTLIRRLEDWSIDHVEIVAIDIDGDDTDELVFYRRDPEGQGTGWGEIYDVTPQAGMSLLSRHTDWPTDNDRVIGVDVPSR